MTDFLLLDLAFGSDSDCNWDPLRLVLVIPMGVRRRTPAWGGSVPRRHSGRLRVGPPGRSGPIRDSRDLPEVLGTRLPSSLARGDGGRDVTWSSDLYGPIGSRKPPLGQGQPGVYRGRKIPQFLPWLSSLSTTKHFTLHIHQKSFYPVDKVFARVTKTRNTGKTLTQRV